MSIKHTKKIRFSFKQFLTVLISCPGLLSCKYPSDPCKTLLTIQKNSILKIGICADFEDDSLLLNKLAKALNAKIIRSKGTFDDLYPLLEKGKINLISCHITNNNPWEQKVAFTTPYQKNYVWAIKQGENAWLKYLDEFIHANRKS